MRTAHTSSCYGCCFIAWCSASHASNGYNRLFLPSYSFCFIAWCSASAMTNRLVFAAKNKLQFLLHCMMLCIGAGNRIELIWTHYTLQFLLHCIVLCIIARKCADVIVPYELQFLLHCMILCTSMVRLYGIRLAPIRYSSCFIACYCASFRASYSPVRLNSSYSSCLIA